MRELFGGLFSSSLSPLIAAASTLFIVGVYCFLRDWEAGRDEDRRWEATRAELGEATVEIIALDTRAFRPFGPSAAVERFSVLASVKGHPWLGALAAPWQPSSPFSIRAVANEIGGVRVAAIVCHTHKKSFLGKLVACAPSGRVVEEPIESPSPYPPPNLVRRLEALATTARAGEGATA